MTRKELDLIRELIKLETVDCLRPRRSGEAVFGETEARIQEIENQLIEEKVVWNLGWGAESGNPNLGDAPKFKVGDLVRFKQDVTFKIVQVGDNWVILDGFPDISYDDYLLELK